MFSVSASTNQITSLFAMEGRVAGELRPKGDLACTRRISSSRRKSSSPERRVISASFVFSNRYRVSRSFSDTSRWLATVAAPVSVIVVATQRYAAKESGIAVVVVHGPYPCQEPQVAKPHRTIHEQAASRGKNRLATKDSNREQRKDDISTR